MRECALSRWFLRNQTAADPPTILGNQLRVASAFSQCTMYDMQTLRMENADIWAKFNVMETEYD